ncbi:MAG: DUF1573 domain-containing protein [bacterium]|nr:DUF1573 domain-containing protein [bacterium]
MNTNRHRLIRPLGTLPAGVSALLLAFACAPAEDSSTDSTSSDTAQADPTPTSDVAAQPNTKGMSPEEAAIAKKKAMAESMMAGNGANRPQTKPTANVRPAYDPNEELPGQEVRGVPKSTGIKGASVTPPKPRRIPNARRVQPNKPARLANAGQKPNVQAGPQAKTQYSAQMNPNAKLEVEFGTESHDFGRARQGDILEHTFEMASAGTEALIIRQASPTCGCTLGRVEIADESGAMQEYVLGDEIPAGRKVNVTARMDTTNKSHKTNVRINVYTNDPIGLTQLGLTANVEPFISATPSFVNFGDLKLDSEQTQVVDVRTSQGEKVKLSIDDTRAVNKPQGLEVNLEAVNPEADGSSAHWRATISVGPDLKEGPLGYSLQLLTEREMPVTEEELAKLRQKDPNAPKPRYRVSANVTGRVLGVLSYSPSFLSMGLVQPGLRVPRTMKLTSHDPNFKLDNVSVELRGEQGAEFVWKDHFTTEVKPLEGEAAVEVTLTLEGLPEGSDGSFRGEMVIKTGHPDKPEVPVRFSGVCRSPIKK